MNRGMAKLGAVGTATLFATGIVVGCGGNSGTDSNQVTITYNAGVLQSASSVSGPYTDVAGATSPYTVTATGEKYYRTHLTAQ